MPKLANVLTIAFKLPLVAKLLVPSPFSSCIWLNLFLYQICLNTLKSPAFCQMAYILGIFIVYMYHQRMLRNCLQIVIQKKKLTTTFFFCLSTHFFFGSYHFCLKNKADNILCCSKFHKRYTSLLKVIYHMISLVPSLI